MTRYVGFVEVTPASLGNDYADACAALDVEATADGWVVLHVLDDDGNRSSAVIGNSPARDRGVRSMLTLAASIVDGYPPASTVTRPGWPSVEPSP